MDLFVALHLKGICDHLSLLALGDKRVWTVCVQQTRSLQIQQKKGWPTDGSVSPGTGAQTVAT